MATDRVREEERWLHSLNLASVLLEGTPLKGQRAVATNPALTCLADIGRRLVIPAMDMSPAVRRVPFQPATLNFAPFCPEFAPCMHGLWQFKHLHYTTLHYNMSGL